MKSTAKSSVKINKKRHFEEGVSSTIDNKAPLIDAKEDTLDFSQVNKPPKKKRKSSDPTYNPRSHNPSKNGKKSGLLNMRANMAKTVVVNGVSTDLKTSVIIDREYITTKQSTPELKKELKARFNNIKTHRPMFVTKFSANNSPLQGETPGKTKLYRKKNWGSILTFDNEPPKTPLKKIETIDENNPLFKSDSYKATITPKNSIKKIRFLITAEILKKAQAEYKKNGYRRVTSQAKAMAKPFADTEQASAKNYVGATKLFPDELIWEILHLVGFSKVGEAAQVEKNLVYGTREANTDMMLIEGQIDNISKKYPLGFWLEIIAELISKVQISHLIDFKVETVDFSIVKKFNPQTPNKPRIQDEEYVRGTVDALLDGKKADSQTNATPPQSSSSTTNLTSTNQASPTLFKPRRRKLDFPDPMTTPSNTPNP